jgi:hypothetical protein
LAEGHGDELIPTGEAFAVPFGLVFADDIREFAAIEKSEYLTEKTGALSHWNLRAGVDKGVDFP